MASISNNEIKKVKSLQQKKFRDEEGLFIAEGDKMLEEAERSRFHVECVYRRDSIGEEAMKRISALASPSPVLAVIRKPSDAYVDDISSLKGLISEGGLFLALDTIRDPGNLGTIIRIADWFGIKAIFAAKDTVDVFNPKVVQATMGALSRVKVHYCDLNESLKKLSSDIPIYGTFLDGENIYTQELSPNGVIIMGNEGRGISHDIAKCVTKKILVPSYPHDRPTSESLNVAVATSIVCAEFRRRLQ